jgi:REP element-mobilizing transposase RayT
MRGGYKTWGKSRSLRLEGVDYGAPGRVYHVIIGSRDNRETFIGPQVNSQVIGILKQAVEISGYELVAYCLMPDHLHVLVQAGEQARSLSGLVGSFKSYCLKATGRKLWQPGFYEHILRKDETVTTVAEYIGNNPVRRGLVAGREEYEWGEVVGG